MPISKDPTRDGKWEERKPSGEEETTATLVFEHSSPTGLYEVSPGISAMPLTPSSIPAFASTIALQAKQSRLRAAISPRQHLYHAPGPRSRPPCKPRRSLMTNADTSIPSPPPSSATRSPTKICTSLTAPTVAEQISQLSAAYAAGADLAEIRVDLLSSVERPNWQQILQGRALPVIVTNRAAWEGGSATEPEPERLKVALQAVRLGAEYVDVELLAAADFRALCAAEGLPFPLPSTRLILSHHNFSRPLTSEEVADVQARMQDAGADVCKIAMATATALDNDLVFRTLKNATTPTVMLAMGELGQVSRIAAGKYGAFLTFASVEQGKESAPGQVDTETLMGQYRFRDITASTPLYGVIGNPVSHSMSPALHNAALAATDTSGLYVPLKVESDVPEFIRTMSTHGFKGFSVTIPGKVDAMAAMDEMDDVAARIGAMNTVVMREDGSLKGYNTDWVAAISAVEEKIQGGLPGKRVLCIGAGGAGRALAFGALERGAAHVTVANRTAAKAHALAMELGDRARGIGLEQVNDAEAMDFDVVMNSTAVGMHPRETDTPLDAKLYKEGMVVFDAVYNPLETRMLKEAIQAGCITVSGLEMFVRQAAEQFSLWFPGLEVPVERMRDVVLERLGHS